jgi:hypothetical protein
VLLSKRCLGAAMRAASQHSKRPQLFVPKFAIVISVSDARFCITTHPMPEDARTPVAPAVGTAPLTRSLARFPSPDSRCNRRQIHFHSPPHSGCAVGIELNRLNDSGQADNIAGAVQLIFHATKSGSAFRIDLVVVAEIAHTHNHTHMGGLNMSCEPARHSDRGQPARI